MKIQFDYASIILCLFKRRTGYVLGIIYGLSHLPLIAFLMAAGRIPSGYSYLRPMNVMITCILIACFCYLEYRKTSKHKIENPFYNSFLVFSYLSLSWICLVFAGVFTGVLRNNNVGIKMLDTVSTPITRIIIIITLIISVLLIVFSFLTCHKANQILIK